MQIDKLNNIINLLKQNSTQDKQTLIELQNQLDDCKSRLTSAQSLLNQQSESLIEVNSLLMKNEASLKTLTEQIKAMEHKIVVLQRQRDMWALAFGAVVVAGLYNNVK